MDKLILPLPGETQVYRFSNDLLGGLVANVIFDDGTRYHQTVMQDTHEIYGSIKITAPDEQDIEAPKAVDRYPYHTMWTTALVDVITEPMLRHWQRTGQLVVPDILR